MQFLIFAFILMSLLSSLRKKARRIRSKEPFFDPWSFGEESPEDKMEDTPENTAETADMGVLKPAEKPEIKEAEEQQDVMDDILYAEEDEKFEPLPKQEKVEPFMPSLLLDEEGERNNKIFGFDRFSTSAERVVVGSATAFSNCSFGNFRSSQALRPTRNRL